MNVSAAFSPPLRDDLLRVGLLLNTLVIGSLVYVVSTNVVLTEPRYALYGLAWILVGVVAVWKTDVAPTDPTTQRRAAAVAVFYFALLAAAGGLVTLPAAQSVWGARLAPLPPGWGPAPVLTTPYVVVGLVPARVVGYLALSYLVYATVIDAAESAISGLLGLFSCVSCTWPFIASLATGALGGGSAVATLALGFSYDISTAVFLVTVALLYWRPRVGGRLGSAKK
ncbi:DUF7546 family protein [Halobellus captivus]|uniref:DUF7546 family protein n=1 Tax=Halobellus captivus TaxID=2592614 RepID=UPI0011A63507|nr:hypothetical protein [Halobellus captivus]